MGKELTETIPNKSGVRQGGYISTKCFTLFLANVLKISQVEGWKSNISVASLEMCITDVRDRTLPTLLTIYMHLSGTFHKV